MEDVASNVSLFPGVSGGQKTLVHRVKRGRFELPPELLEEDGPMEPSRDEKRGGEAKDGRESAPEGRLAALRRRVVIRGEALLILDDSATGRCRLRIPGGLTIITDTRRALGVYILRGNQAYERLYIDAGANGFLDAGLLRRMQRPGPPVDIQAAMAAPVPEGLGDEEDKTGTAPIVKSPSGASFLHVDPTERPHDPHWWAEITGWGGLEQKLEGMADFHDVRGVALGVPPIGHAADGAPVRVLAIAWLAPVNSLAGGEGTFGLKAAGRVVAGAGEAALPNAPLGVGRSLADRQGGRGAQAYREARGDAMTRVTASRSRDRRRKRGEKPKSEKELAKEAQEAAEAMARLLDPFYLPPVADLPPSVRSLLIKSAEVNSQRVPPRGIPYAGTEERLHELIRLSHSTITPDVDPSLSSTAPKRGLSSAKAQPHGSPHMIDDPSTSSSTLLRSPPQHHDHHPSPSDMGPEEPFQPPPPLATATLAPATSMQHDGETMGEGDGTGEVLMDASHHSREGEEGEGSGDERGRSGGRRRRRSSIMMEVMHGEGGRERRESMAGMAALHRMAGKFRQAHLERKELGIATGVVSRESHESHEESGSVEGKEDDHHRDRRSGEHGGGGEGVASGIVPLEPGIVIKTKDGVELVARAAETPWLHMAAMGIVPEGPCVPRLLPFAPPEDPAQLDAWCHNRLMRFAPLGLTTLILEAGGWESPEERHGGSGLFSSESSTPAAVSAPKPLVAPKVLPLLLEEAGLRLLPGMARSLLRSFSRHLPAPSPTEAFDLGGGVADRDAVLEARKRRKQRVARGPERAKRTADRLGKKKKKKDSKKKKKKKKKTMGWGDDEEEEDEEDVEVDMWGERVKKKEGGDAEAERSSALAELKRRERERYVVETAKAEAARAGAVVDVAAFKLLVRVVASARVLCPEWLARPTVADAFAVASSDGVHLDFAEFLVATAVHGFYAFADASGYRLLRFLDAERADRRVRIQRDAQRSLDAQTNEMLSSDDSEEEIRARLRRPSTAARPETRKKGRIARAHTRRASLAAAKSSKSSKSSKTRLKQGDDDDDDDEEEEYEDDIDEYVEPFDEVTDDAADFSPMVEEDFGGGVSREAVLRMQSAAQKGQFGGIELSAKAEREVEKHRGLESARRGLSMRSLGPRGTTSMRQVRRKKRRRRRKKKFRVRVPTTEEDAAWETRVILASKPGERVALVAGEAALALLRPPDEEWAKRRAARGGGPTIFSDEDLGPGAAGAAFATFTAKDGDACGSGDIPGSVGGTAADGGGATHPSGKEPDIAKRYRAWSMQRQRQLREYEDYLDAKGRRGFKKPPRHRRPHRPPLFADPVEVVDAAGVGRAGTTSVFGRGAKARVWERARAAFLRYSSDLSFLTLQGFYLALAFVTIAPLEIEERRLQRPPGMTATMMNQQSSDEIATAPPPTASQPPPPPQTVFTATTDTTPPDPPVDSYGGGVARMQPRRRMKVSVIRDGKKPRRGGGPGYEMKVAKRFAGIPDEASKPPTSRRRIPPPLVGIANVDSPPRARSPGSPTSPTLTPPIHTPSRRGSMGGRRRSSIGMGGRRSSMNGRRASMMQRKSSMATRRLSTAARRDSQGSLTSAPSSSALPQTVKAAMTRVQRKAFLFSSHIRPTSPPLGGMSDSDPGSDGAILHSKTAPQALSRTLTEKTQFATSTSPDRPIRKKVLRGAATAKPSKVSKSFFGSGGDQAPPPGLARRTVSALFGAPDPSSSRTRKIGDVDVTVESHPLMALMHERKSMMKSFSSSSSDDDDDLDVGFASDDIHAIGVIHGQRDAYEAAARLEEAEADAKRARRARLQEKHTPHSRLKRTAIAVAVVVAATGDGHAKSQLQEAESDAERAAAAKREAAAQEKSLSDAQERTSGLEAQETSAAELRKVMELVKLRPRTEVLAAVLRLEEQARLAAMSAVVDLVAPLPPVMSDAAQAARRARKREAREMRVKFAKETRAQVARDEAERERRKKLLEEEKKLTKKAERDLANRRAAERAAERTAEQEVAQHETEALSRAGADVLDLSNRSLRSAPNRAALQRACDDFAGALGLGGAGVRGADRFVKSRSASRRASDRGGGDGEGRDGGRRLGGSALERKRPILFDEHIVRLSLADNLIRVIPSSLAILLTGLIDLDLSGNRLSSLPPEISTLSGLRSLRVSRNGMRELPPSIGRGLRNLELLDAASNELTTIPAELLLLPRLQVLLLSGNYIVNLPDDPPPDDPSTLRFRVEKEAAERAATVVGGASDGLDPELRGPCIFPRLRYIDLACNHIERLPRTPWLLRLPHTADLNLDGNPLRALSIDWGPGRVELRRLAEVAKEDEPPSGVIGIDDATPSPPLPHSQPQTPSPSPSPPSPLPPAPSSAPPMPQPSPPSALPSFPQATRSPSAGVGEHADLIEGDGEKELDVVVENRFGVASEGVGVGVFGRAEVVGPREKAVGVWGWREAGVYERVHVAWLYPVADASADLRDVAVSFVVTAKSLRSPPTSTSRLVTAQDAAGAGRQLTTPTSTTTHRRYATTLPVSLHTPYNISVAAVNAQGGGSEEGVGKEWVVESCASGEFLFTSTSPSLTTCLPCPIGARCDAFSNTTTLFRLPGIFRLSDAWLPDGLGFTTCPQPLACVGDDAELPDASAESFGLTLSRPPHWNHSSTIPNIPTPSTSQCREGHEGLLCARCQREYFTDPAGLCRKCPSKELIALGMVGLVVVTMLVVGAFLAKTLSKDISDGKKTTTALKIMYHHCQRIAIIGTVVMVQWPNVLRDFFTGADSVSMFGTGGLAFMECALGKDANNLLLKTSLTAFLLPFSLILFSAIFWWAWPHVCAPLAQRCCRREGELWMSGARRREGTGPSVVREERRGVGKEMSDRYEEWRNWRNRFQVSALVIGTLIHATLVRSALLTVACFPVQPLSVPAHLKGSDDPSTYSSSRLVSDPSISCSSTTYSSLLTLGSLTLIIGGLGIPLILLIATFSNRHKLQDVSFRRKWGFAVDAYREKAYLWEGVVLLVKMALVVVVVLLMQQGPVAQLSAGVVVEVIALMLQAWFKPYKAEVMNQVDLAGHVTTTFTLALSLNLVTSQTPSSNTIVSLLIIGVNTAYFLLSIFLTSDRILLLTNRCPCPHHSPSTNLLSKPSTPKITIPTQSTSPPLLTPSSRHHHHHRHRASLTGKRSTSSRRASLGVSATKTTTNPQPSRPFRSGSRFGDVNPLLAAGGKKEVG